MTTQAQRIEARKNQKAVWDSINSADHSAIAKLAIDADCVREIDGINYYVPPTGHWAGWHDRDAIRHHGITSVEQLCERFAATSSEPWDGTYRHLWLYASSL